MRPSVSRGAAEEVPLPSGQIAWAILLYQAGMILVEVAKEMAYNTRPIALAMEESSPSTFTRDAHCAMPEEGKGLRLSLLLQCNEEPEARQLA